MTTEHIKRSLAAWLLPALALLGAGGTAAGADYPVNIGYLKGAQIAVATPAKWNRRLLLLAHGYRPDNAPLLADLHPERAALKAALDDGWIVATTSYRHNGLAIGDAIADLDGLRAYVEQAYGSPERVILEGESLGGLIVTLMAERDDDRYAGAIAFDATLYAKERNSEVGLSLLPRIPVLFVATLREVRQARSYLTTLVARPSPIVQPALFLIKREGHTNINQAEHAEAFDAMNAWLDHGPNALPTPQNQALYYDATIAPDPGPSTAVIRAEDHSFDTKVAEVDAVYGNVLLEAQAVDFDFAGIPPMTYFTVTVNGRSYRALYGRTYTDVKSGEWVAFPDADGRTVLSRTYADGAKEAGLQVGTTLTLTAIAPSGAPSR